MEKRLGMKFEIMSVRMAFTRLISERNHTQCVTMKSRTSVVSIASIVVSLFFSIGLASIPSAYAVTPSGQVNYFNVSGGVCTSTAWTGATALDGNVPGSFPNNLVPPGPPNAPVVGTGSICIQVVLTGATPNTTYTITATQLSCTITVTTDGSGNGSGEAVCTSTFSGACTTNPLKMSPETPFVLSGGQIDHVWVGTGGNCSTVTHGVPEFPAGLAILVMLTLPAVLLLKKRASLYQ
jgi:hypothetical protein